MEQEKIFERLLQIITRYYQNQEQGLFVEYLDPAVLQQRLGLENGRETENWEQLFSWVELYLAHAVKTSSETDRPDAMIFPLREAMSCASTSG